MCTFRGCFILFPSFFFSEQTIACSLFTMSLTDILSFAVLIHYDYNDHVQSYVNSIVI